VFSSLCSICGNPQNESKKSLVPTNIRSKEYGFSMKLNEKLISYNKLSIDVNNFPLNIEKNKTSSKTSEEKVSSGTKTPSKTSEEKVSSGTKTTSKCWADISDEEEETEHSPTENLQKQTQAEPDSPQVEGLDSKTDNLLLQIQAEPDHPIEDLQKQKEELDQHLKDLQKQIREELDQHLKDLQKQIQEELDQDLKDLQKQVQEELDQQLENLQKQIQEELDQQLEDLQKQIQEEKNDQWLDEFFEES